MAAVRRAPRTTLAPLRSLTATPAAPFLRAPTERWQHGTVQAPTDETTAVLIDGAAPVGSTRTVAQRVRSPVLALIASNRIARSDHHAAERWLRDHELASGAREQVDHLHVQTSPSVGGYDRVAVTQIDALARSRDAATAVGRAGHDLLVLAVAQSLSLTALSALYTPATTKAPPATGACRQVTDVREVSGRLVAVLERLSEHYATVDDAKSRRQVYADHVPAADRSRPRRQGETPTVTAADVSWDGRRARHSPTVETQAH